MRLLPAIFQVWVLHLVWASLALAQPPVAPPPAIDARSWLLLDLQSHQIIASHNADERIEPASLTKLMSAYLIFDALKQKRLTLEQRLPVSARAWQMPGSRMFVQPGTTPTVEELLRGMIVVSGNDATIVLAEGLTGSEEAFVQRMNAQAQRMGLEGTRFTNATGLPDPQHHSSVNDLSRLAQALIRDFPGYLPLYALRSYSHNGITQANRNVLLGRDPRVDGLKTGYTRNAGFCLIATARSADRHLLALVSGTVSESTRAIQAQKLLNYGFQHYQTVRLYAQGATVAELPVWKGSANRLRAGFDHDVYVSLPRGQGRLLKATLSSQQPLLAPVSRQQQVGVLRLTFDGNPLGEYPVVALENVSVANIFVRMWDGLRLLLD